MKQLSERHAAVSFRELISYPLYGPRRAAKQLPLPEKLPLPKNTAKHRNGGEDGGKQE